jgi:hypothetical protein
MADRYQYNPGAAGARDHDNHQRSAEGDPLAELARLIGQNDANAPRATRAAAAPQPQHYEEQYQDQLLEPVEAEPVPPSWMRTATSTGWQQPAPTMHPAHATAFDQEHYPAEQQAHDQHQHQHAHGHQAEEYAETPAFLRLARQHDQTRYDDVLYDQNSQNAPQYADGQYPDNYNYQDQTDPNGGYVYADEVQDEPKRRRGGLMTVAAVLALAVVGTAAAYGYRSFTGSPRSGEPPVIKAEAGGNKIVPPTQTGDASGKIADRMNGTSGGQERVLSREEQPIDISRNSPRVVFPPPNQNSSAATAVAAATQAAPPAAAQPAQPSGTLNDEPKRVRTFAIRPDQPDTVPSGTTPPQRPTQARAQAPAPSGNGPISLSPQTSSAPVRTAAVASSGGGYMVQISSQRSEADAQASYRAMQSKFPNVLGSQSASIRRADLGEKGIYYRALVGPFAAAEEAGQLCNSLKSAGGQCVVQRN